MESYEKLQSKQV